MRISLLIAILIICLAAVAGAETFPEYMSSRSAATTPPGTTDRLLIRQDSVLKMISPTALERVVTGGTCSSTYNVNPANGSHITLTLNGACQIGVTSLAAGQGFILYLTQSSTVPPTFTSEYKWQAGTAPSWSASATKYDVISCVSPDGAKLVCGAMIDVR
jgi:hypothetical protein